MMDYKNFYKSNTPNNKMNSNKSCNNKNFYSPNN